MAFQYTLKDTDTIQGLALQFLGDATRWTEIVDYNKLDYPYIEDFTYSRHASGFVRIIRANYTHAAVIKAGWTFKTKPYALLGGMVKIFKVTEDVYIPAGLPEVHVPVECTVPGSIGNVMAGFITEVGEDTASSGVHFVYVNNEEPLSGGGSSNVKRAGETIFIPAAGVDELSDSELTLVGGEDFVLDNDGMLVADSYGDIATVSGIENIQYAVASRLCTSRGELPMHPEYGHDLDELIGTARTPYTERLAEIRIVRALSYEDRIEDVVINSLRIEGTSVYVDLSYTVKTLNLAVNQQVTI